MIQVAVGLISDNQQRLLITQRAAHASHGSCWEFPGGKLETDETALSALKRELYEEIGIDVITASFLTTIEHVYSERKVALSVFHVVEFHGEAYCREGQLDLRWVTCAQLSDYSFPEANEKIIHHWLQLTNS